MVQPKYQPKAESHRDWCQVLLPAATNMVPPVMVMVIITTPASHLGFDSDLMNGF